MRALVLVVAVALCGCPGGGGGGTGGGSGGSTAGGTGGSTAGGSGGATGGGSGGATGGGSGGGAAFDAGTLTAAQLCSSYVDAICDYYVRCNYAETHASCASLLANRFVPGFSTTCLQDEQQAVAAGRATYDDRAAAGCLHAIRANATCDATGLDYIPECQSIIHGRVTDGGCAQSFECDPSAYCDSSLQMCPGHCFAKKPAGADAGSDQECQSGYYSYDGHCRLYALTGLSCSPVAPSTTPQRCQPRSAFCNAQQTCQAVRTDGYPCTIDSDCAFPFRCNNDHCSLGAGLGQTCQYRFFPADPSQACKVDLACVGGTRRDGGTCQPLQPLDAGCFGAFECAGNAVCPGIGFAYDAIAMMLILDAGTCSPPVLGAPCVAGPSEGNFCDVGTTYCRDDAGCTARRARGSNASCTAENQCTPLDSCVAGTCRRPVCVTP